MWRKEIKITPYPTLTRLIVYEKWNYSTVLKVDVKNKQANQSNKPKKKKTKKTETTLPLLRTAFLYSSDHAEKATSPDTDLHTFILEKPDEQFIPRAHSITSSRTTE